jgi:replicative DNA helicase
MAIEDRLPPQNIAAEQGVIGSILLENEVFLEIDQILAPDHFYRESHRIAYTAIRDMLREANAVDAVTLAAELQRRGQYDEVGGIDFLESIITSVPHSLNGRYYAEIVREKSILLSLVESANETLNMAYSQRHTSADVMRNVEERLIGLSSRSSTAKGPRPIGEFLAQALWRIAQRKDGIFKESSVLTGFRDFDLLTGGLPRGAMIVIAGRPGMGKTVAGMQIAESCASRGVPTGFFSLEMPGVDLAERALSGRAQVPSHILRRGHTSNQDMKVITSAYDEIIKSGNLWVGDESLSISQVMSQSRKLKLREKVDLIVLDYLQLVDPEDDFQARRSREEFISMASAQFKRLAKALDIPVICLAQLNRMSLQRKDKRPDMGDLRESGAIEQNADMVILLHRPEYYDYNDQPGIAEMIVAKNRNGPCETIRLYFDKEFTRFRDFEHKDDMF